jgi:hypothetical protein
MELHRFKKLNFGFGIIAPQSNIGAIMCTVRTIKNHYPGVSFVCAISRNTDAAAAKEIESLCPVYRGKDTITSLMNTVLKRGHKEWNLIIMEGTPVRAGVDKKLSLFVENEKDVLFPIVMEHNRKGEICAVRDTFPNASLNSTFIHQKTFKLVGDFTDDSIMDSKFLWMAKALEVSCKFKAILGTKLL